MDLQRQATPSGTAGCQKGGTLSCLEYEAQMMSVCICGAALRGRPLPKPVVGNSTPAACWAGGIPPSRRIVGTTATAKARYDMSGCVP